MSYFWCYKIHSVIFVVSYLRLKTFPAICRLFFDKRDESGFDLLTVNETANDLPGGDSGNNSLTKLGLEATYINQNFSQQCLKRETKQFKRPNPFINEEDEGEPCSVAYRLAIQVFFLSEPKPLALVRMEFTRLTISRTALIYLNSTTSNKQLHTI